MKQILFFTMCSLACTSSIAGPIFFDDRAQFLTGTSGEVLVHESFEGLGIQSGNPLVIDSLITVSEQGGDLIDVTSNSRFVSDGTQGLAFANDASTGNLGNSPITFTFASALSSFSLDILDAGTNANSAPGLQDIIFKVNGVTSTVVADIVSLGSLGQVTFAGVYDSAGFTSLEIELSNKADYIGADNLRYSLFVDTPTQPVPAPTGSMFFVGSLMLLFRRYWNSGT